jgi:hypothetical protein
VPKSVRPLAEINELNRHSKWAKVSWNDKVVLVGASGHWTSVDNGSLMPAMAS